nr:hypothetical protein [Candidatus Freyarchaeota archaeon]
MDVKQAINERRAYRSLKPLKITEQLVKDLAESAQLTPSCFNKREREKETQVVLKDSTEAHKNT